MIKEYEGIITTYKESSCYKANLCNLDCNSCNLTLNLDETKEVKAVGIEKLLSDYDNTISFTPRNNERMERRNNE